MKPQIKATRTFSTLETSSRFPGARTRSLFLAAAVFLLASLVFASEAADIVEGIQPYQVFPYKGYRGDITFRAKVNGQITALVSDSRSGTIVAEGRWEISPDAPPTFDRPGRVAGLIRTSARDLYIANVPINRGGEYTVRFTHGEDTQEIPHVLVGDLWVIAGGVNLFGAPGRRIRRPVPAVHFFRDGKWQPGEDPLFPSGEPLPPRTEQITPWLRAAQDYHRLTGIPVGLMGWAEPSLSLITCWDASGEEIPVLKALMENHGRGASVFILWQGEADAYPQAIALYGQKLEAMAAAVRRYAGNPDVLLAILQAPSFKDPRGLPPTPYLGRIRDLQRRFSLADERAILIPTMQYPQRDSLRLDEQGVELLGKQVGEVLTTAKETKQARSVGPQPLSATFASEDRRQILLRFQNTDRLILEPNTEKDWAVTDDGHLGYPEGFVEGIQDGVLTLRLGGARFGNIRDASDEGIVRMGLKDHGFIGVMRVSLLGSTTVRLDLESPAGADTKISHCLWDDSKGSLLGGEGDYAPAFADFPVTETGERAPRKAIRPAPTPTPSPVAPVASPAATPQSLQNGTPSTPKIAPTQAPKKKRPSIKKTN